MNETINQDERYPEWMKAWNARTAEIDQQILDYFDANLRQTGVALDNIAEHIQQWLEQQEIDAQARAEQAREAAEDKARLAERIQQRIDRLEAEGLLPRQGLDPQDTQSY